MAGEWLFGSAPSVKTKSTLTPEQQQIMGWLLNALGGDVFDVTNTPASGGDEYIWQTSTDGEGRTIRKRIKNPNYVAASTTVNGLKPVEAYPGQITPEMGGMNKTLMQQALKLITGGDPNAPIIKSAIGKYSKDFDPADITKLFEKTVKPKAMRTFNEEILPSIAEKFAGRGSFDSGGTLHEFTKAGGDLASDLSGQLESMISTAREGSLNRSANILPQLLSILSGGTMDALKLGTSLGTTTGQVEQDLLASKGQEDYSKWSMTQPYNNPMLQMIMQALGMQTQQAVVNPGSEGLLPTIISGGSKILSSIL